MDATTKALKHTARQLDELDDALFRLKLEVEVLAIRTNLALVHAAQRRW